MHASRLFEGHSVIELLKRPQQTVPHSWCSVW